MVGDRLFGRDANKDLSLKVKARTKDFTLKAKASTKDLSPVVNESLSTGPRPRTNITAFWTTLYRMWTNRQPEKVTKTRKTT